MASLAATMMMRGEAREASAETDLGPVIERHVLAGGAVERTAALLAAYAALGGAGLVSCAAAELVARAAAVRGFRAVLPRVSEEAAEEAAYDWPDALPWADGLPIAVVANIFYALGHAAGVGTKGWYDHCAATNAEVA